MADHDPQRAMEVQNRLDTIYRLQKKHGVSSVADLLKIALGQNAPKT